MGKRIRFEVSFVVSMVCFVIVLCVLFAGVPAYASSAQITLPDFAVTLNGMLVDNATRQYPLIVYRNITYFPMTYHDTRFLGLESNYSASGGLDIKKAGAVGGYNGDRISGTNPRTGTARTAAFPIHVNDKPVDNGREEYPLLLYRDVTYFPLTWRFAVEEFGWIYDFDSTYGLVIDSHDAEDLSELLKGLYGQQSMEIIRDATNKIQASEWLNLTFRSFSRYEDKVIGTQKEYNTGESEQYQHLLALLKKIPAESYSNARWGFYAGYPCLIVSYMDEEPTSMPIRNADGGIYGGSISRHTFYFDLQGRRLLSYWCSAIPLSLTDDGELIYIAPPTTWYDIIDIG